MCAYEHHQALMSMVLWCHERSWRLMSAPSLMAPCSWLLLSSHECSLLHGAKLRRVHGCSWVINGNQEHSWLLLAAYECSLGLMGAHEGSGLLIAALMWSKELGGMEQRALMGGQEQSWAWNHEAMSTYQHSRALMAPYSWVLDGAHKHTWALMGAHECSQQVMSAKLIYQIINQKC